ncbi:helix-turn-helix domain-containing protein [Opitutaceae bacterium LMO-CP1]|nr:helix-turn-helix domain-containing protein [Opitutaceae bacterium LMO-M01]
MHTHDFPEIFWLERGRGRHHINGQRRSLDTGDLIFVRPADRHVLETVDAEGFILINVAYAPDIRKELIKRHPEEIKPLLDPGGLLPHRAKLSAATLGAWRRRLDPLGANARSRVTAEAFLLNLIAQVSDRDSPARPPLPAWLQSACDDVQQPAVFALGAPGLVRAAGRSAEHVARTMRTALNLTPSEFVNGVRMAHAARELRVTERPIADIALDCGLSNLSHFYALFKQAHGMTPRNYRLAHHRTVL